MAAVETFVIRVWTPAECVDDPERFRLRGVAEHVSSGERRAFEGAGELLAFVEARVERPLERVLDAVDIAPQSTRLRERTNQKENR